VATRSSASGHDGRVLWSSVEVREGEPEARASAGEAPSEPRADPLRRLARWDTRLGSGVLGSRMATMHWARVVC
jgi:hypothetical protein